MNAKLLAFAANLSALPDNDVVNPHTKSGWRNYAGRLFFDMILAD
jgi:hypothetical protein